MSKWLSVEEWLPDCDMTPDSLGVEVIVYPPLNDIRYNENSLCFYGCRVTDEPNFYIYGKVRHDVTHWMYVPDPPKGKK